MILIQNGYTVEPQRRFVYIDKKPCGEPFYVGIGNSSRVKSPSRKNRFHSAVTIKYKGWTRTIVESADFESCKEFERLLIAEIGRRDCGFGPLTNHTDGGDGVLGRIVGAEERANNPAKLPENRKASSLRMTTANPMKIASVALKVSQSLLGKKLPEEVIEKIRSANTGKKRTEEQRKRFGVAQKGRKLSEERIAQQRAIFGSEEMRKRLSLAQKGRPLTAAHKAALKGTHVGYKWVVELASGRSTTAPADVANAFVLSGTHKYGRKL